MTLVESEAAFQQRCREITGNDDLYTELSRAGVKTFSSMAFSLGTPQTAPTEQQFENFAQNVYGVARPTVGQLSSLRRLHFEATALMVATIKENVSAEADKTDVVKKLPLVEKKQRQENQTTRLAGVQIVGELNPSHSLIDLANHILTTGSIVWIAPSRCTKRDDEVQTSVKERSQSVQIENNQLKVGSTSNEIKADVGSELKLQWAWQRRGIAMDQGSPPSEVRGKDRSFIF